MVAFANSFQRAVNRFSGGLIGWLFGEDYEQDQYMTATRALSYAPVWNCVSRITGAFSVMPLNIHREQGRKKTIQKQHSSYNLFRWRPNSYQTPSVFKQQMICHALLWGNARSFIRREGTRPVELIPLLPDSTATMMFEGEKWHGTVADADARLKLYRGDKLRPDDVIWLPDADVWHIPGLGFDGLEGKSLISLAKQSWGIGLDAEKHVARQQKKGYAGGLMLEAPVGAFRNQEEAKEFLKHFKANHEGADNAGTIGLLREGIKANVMAMNNSDAQFIEQRKFNREDAALWFVMQSILGDSSGNSYASLEQKNLAQRMECLAPWSTKIEEESDMKLLTASERNRGYYHKFNDGALLRTEKKATMEFVSAGIAARVLSPNEGREYFDLNPYEGGDKYENPNTIARGSEKPAKETKDDSPDEDEEDDSSDQNVAIRSRIHHMIDVECKRIIESAAKASSDGFNFVSWVDNFYEKNWSPKLASVFTELGLEDSRAIAWCEESKQRLLNCCDYSTVETLPENVAKCVFSWKIREY
jgi:HK97 family phage portal protein